MTGVQINYISKRLDVYREGVDAEELMHEHHTAMLCFDYESLVKDGNNLIERLHELDEDWRLLVYEKKIEYDGGFEQQVVGLFRSWLETSLRIVAMFDGWLKQEYESREFDVQEINKLRQSCSEVQMTLIPNGEFFANEKTCDLADQALQQHQTEELESLGDLFGSLNQR